MKTLSEKGFAAVLIVLAVLVAVSGAGATVYYVKKSADDKKAREAAQQVVKDTVVDEIEDIRVTTPNVPDTENKPDTTPACVRDTTMYIAVPEGHALRNEKALNATKLVAVPFRGEVKVGCKEGDWYSAEFNGKVGYAYGDYLSATQPAVAATGNMNQDKCLSVSALYTVKSSTPLYKYKDGKMVATGQTVARGTTLTGGECAMAFGNVIPGYWDYDGNFYSFNDLSTVKP